MIKSTEFRLSTVSQTRNPALGLCFAFYNFGRKHMTLKETPAIAIGLEDRIWTIRELIEESAKF